MMQEGKNMREAPNTPHTAIACNHIAVSALCFNLWSSEAYILYSVTHVLANCAL